MKKITLLLAISLAGASGFAQSQRTVLFEQFTQASCPPCAATNPPLNALLNAHPQEVVSIKYQTNWPGTDPMNIDNPTDVATRVTYYSVTGVPDGELDGGTAFSGQPGGMVYSDISTRYATASPFTINVNYNVNATNDTMFVTAMIRCTQDVSMTTPVAHVAIVERNIFWLSAPGTNGEKHFESVMKKMLPSAAGTTIPTSWTVGDSLQLSFAYKLGHIYNKNELAAVAFVQDNATKEVLQAGYKAPNITLDAGVNDITNIVGVQCSSDITPHVIIQNFAPTTLTSASIGYSIDNGAVSVYNWTGSVASYGSSTVTLPLLTLVGAGSHTLKTYAFNPNGGMDQEPFNDTLARAIYVYNSNVTTPVSQTFISAVFPPAGFASENVDHDDYSWSRSTSGHNGAGSGKLNFYSAADGTIDNLYAPKFDFTNAIAGSILTFDVAHAIYSASYSDRLKVNVSSDCGATWTNVYDKAGSTLATVTAAQTAVFTPSAAQWRLETVSLDQFIGLSELLVQFQGISAFGNNIYVDNINITDGTVSVPVTVFEQGVKLYPNPATNLAYLSVKLEKTSDLQVKIMNALGAQVRSYNFNNVNNEVLNLDLQGLSQGNYVVTVICGNQVVNNRLNITE